MRQQTAIMIVVLLLVSCYLSPLGTLPAKAQPFTSPGTRYGISVGQPQYTEYAYTDVFMESLGWKGVSTYTSNGYPATGSNPSVWFCLYGDPPGPQTYHFYGEGIFTLSQFNGNFCPSNYSFVPGTLSILPPNYPGNPNNFDIVIPANYPGNPLNTPVTLFEPYPGTYNFQHFTIPANTPANPLPIPLCLKANSPPNTLNVVVTTCDAQYNIPSPPVPAGYSLINSLPLSWIIISNVNPQGLANEYPNNFHFIRPGYPAWKSGDSFYPVSTTSYPIFTKEYINSFAPFCCIRFMDWMNTNGNTGITWGSNGIVNNGPYSWANRPQLNYFGNSSGGQGGGTNACYENMIALCNATNCDMWMNVPLQATDDWKTGFANLVVNDPVYHLNPWLHVYYEHGNELWNWSFIAWQLVDQLAQTDFPAYSTAPWFYHGQEMGKLIMSDVNDMQSILGPSMGRPIVGGFWNDAADYAGGALTYIQNTYGPPKNYVYAMEGAAYFTDLTSASITSLQSAMAACMQVANQYGIRFVCYEAGQSLASTPQATYNTNLALQTTQAMATQYQALATMWQQNGGDLMNWFARDGTWSQFGYWGLLPLGAYYIDNLSNPVCTKFNTVAAISAVCNCGNAAPAPPPPSSGNPPTQSGGSGNSGSSGSGNSGGQSGNGGNSNAGKNSGSSNSSGSNTNYTGNWNNWFRSKTGVPVHGSN